MKKTTRVTLIMLAVIALMIGCKKTETVIANLDDAKEARIGVMTGSTGEAITIKRFPEAQVKSFDDIMDAVAAMNSGQLDAIVTAFPAALQVSKKSQHLELLSEPLDYEDTAIAVKKGNGELLAALNRIIAELKSDGTLESMKQRWFKKDLSPYEEMDITLPTEGQPLKIGVSATREPFSFVDKNGRVTGHDGELARIIGAKLNRPVEFFNMKFMALIPALQSGRVDLIVTGMTATEERKKYVDFTEPYYANAQVMLVRKSAAATSPTTGNNNEIAKLEDIDGKRVAVLGGSAGDLAARRHFPNASFQVFVASADAALAVKVRKADAFVYDKSVLLNLAEKNPELVILEQPVDKLEIAAAIRKDNTALLADINRVMSELKQEGVLKQLRHKWIDTKYTVTPQISPINETRSKEVLRMGTCATIEPFSFQADGKLTGLDIELSRLIGQRLGKKIEIIDMSFESLIPALQSGKIDFALSNFNVTEERKKLVNFSMAYVENDISALVRRLPAQDSVAKKQDAKLASVADLKDKRIGVLVGSAHDTYATKNFPEAAILQYKSPADVALAVKTGKVDAALFDAEPLREIMRQNDSLGLLGDSLFDFDVGVGFNKDNLTLRDQFNRFLAEIKQNGVHRDMVQRWMEKGDTHMPVIKNAKTNGVIVAGVSDVGLPFTAVKDNRLVGFDIELCERFAAYLGKEVRFANMDFGSLIAAVSTGKVDMIASSIYVTEERKKQINFSDAYYQMGTRVFALKKNISAGAAEPVQGPRNKLSTVDDLKDKRIGVLLGSVHDTYAMEHYPKATILQYKSLPDLVLAVKLEKIDAAIYTRETLIELLRSDNELGLLGDSLQSYPIGMGFNKNNDHLRERFNVFLKQIKSNGDFDDMVKRWLKNGSIETPEIPNTGANGVLVVGIVSDKGLPFATVKDGKLVGFDIELAERFGAYLGKKVEYADMEFGNLIAAVSSGKIDMIDSTLMLTEERKTRIDFSDPYYELGANAFALRKNLAVHDEAGPNAETESPTFFTNIANSFRSNIIQENRYLLIWDGLKTTVIISIFATLLGTLLGALVCFMRMSKRTVLNLPARVYINIIRGMPVLVLLMLIFYVVFASVDINPVLVAIIAFGMNFAAYVSEIFRSGIEGIGKGQIEAGIAMGFTKFKTFVYIVLPQTVQRILPVYKGEFISLVKMTSIVGYIAVQDLTKASDIIRSRTFDAFFPLVMVAILYFVIAWILMQSLEYLERMTDPKYKRRKAMKS